MPLRLLIAVSVSVLVLTAWLLHRPARAAFDTPASVDLHHEASEPAALVWQERVFPSNATVQDVRHSDNAWAAATPMVARPLRLSADQVLWTRFQLAPYGALSPPRWTLEFPRPMLERVELYRFVDGELELQEVSGDSIPVGLWPLIGRYPTFDVAPTHWSPVTYYVRVVQRGPTTLHAMLWRAEESQRRQWISHLGFGGLIGALVLVVVQCLGSLLRPRRASYLSLALYGSALSMTLLATTGLLGELVPQLSAGALARIPPTMILLAAASGLVHLATTLSLWDLSRRATWTLVAVAGIGLALAVGTSTLTWPHSAVSLVYLSLAAIVALLLIDLARRRGDRWSVLQLAALMPLMLAVALPLGEALGWMAVTPESLGASCFFLLVHLLGQYFAVDAKTTTLSRANSRLQASPTVDPLTGLANYRALLESAPQIMERAALRQSQGALLLVELVTDGVLSSTGPMRRREHVVLRAAHLIRSCARDNHLVARIDDAHFVLIMEAPVTLRDASDIASHIVAKGLRGGDEPHYGSLVFRVVVCALTARTGPVQEVLAGAVRRLRSSPMDNPRRIFMDLSAPDIADEVSLHRDPAAD
ncbi:MAG: hypothetical protein NVS2B4_04930 [Ramlibacter sp.]